MSNRLNSKTLLSSLLSIGILIYIVYKALTDNFYTEDQLNEARLRALTQAKKGYYPAAISRFKLLIEHNPKSQELGYDYLAVLLWAGYEQAFFENYQRLDFKQPPSYLIDTIADFIENNSDSNRQNDFLALYKHLLGSRSFRNSDYLAQIYSANEQLALRKDFLQLLASRQPEHPLLLDVSLTEVVNLARTEQLKGAISKLDELLLKYPTKQKLLAEYITIHNWARDHEKATSVASLIKLEQQPNYSVNALANSFLAMEQLEQSLHYFKQLASRKKLSVADKHAYQKRVELVEQQIENIRFQAEQRLEAKQEEKLLLIREQRKRQRQAAMDERQRWLKSASFEQINQQLIEQPYSKELLNQWHLLAKKEQYGDFNKQIPHLAFYLTKHPTDSLLFQDYLVLLSWSEQHQLAINRYLNADTKIKGQAFFYEALAKSAKESEHVNLSLDLYQKAINLNKDSVQLQMGKASVLEQLGQQQAAVETLTRLQSHEQQNVELLFRLAAIYRNNKQPIDAVYSYNQIIDIVPQSQEAHRGKSRALLDAGLPIQAFEYYQQQQDYFNKSDQKALYSAMNTYYVRLAGDDSDLIEQKQLINKARLYNEHYLQLLVETEQAAINNAYADRLTLDYYDKAHNKVIKQYEAFEQEAPNYILNMVSSSYLALEKPELALTVAHKKLAVSATDYQALTNAYYSSLELEDYSSAANYLQQLDENIAAYFYSVDGKRAIENPKRESVELNKAMHLTYINKLQQAENALLELLEIAPGNNEYRVSLANIYRWRGWLEASQKQLDIVTLSDSDYLPQEIAQVHLSIDQQDYSLAAKSIDELNQQHPSEESVKLLNKRWRLHNTNSLQMEMSASDTKGSSFASQDSSHSIRWFSKPLAEHWRLSAFSQQQQAEFFSTEQTIDRQGVGLEYRSSWGAIEQQLFTVKGQDQLEYSISANWKIDDSWSISSSLQSFSEQTPVRAFADGVDAPSFDLNFSYRRDERFESSLSFTKTNFSDGNRRSSGLLNVSQSIYRGPRQTVTLSGLAYWQENTLDTNRNYFNPKSLANLSLAVDYDGTLFRRYQKKWSHQLRLEVGNLKQETFNNKAVYNLYYQQKLQFSNYFSLHYGLGYSRKYFDGDAETGPNYNLGMEYRF